MRHDRALAKELNTVLAGFHDEAVSADPFTWADGEEDSRRRESELEGLRQRLTAYVHVSRAAAVTKLLGFGTLLPLTLFAILVWVDSPADPELRAWTWAPLVITAVVFAVVALATWWPASIGDDVAFALYAVPHGWSFSRLHGRAVWKVLRDRYGYFDRGDEEQAIIARVWGHLDEERQRPFMMFAFYWVEVHRRPGRSGKKAREVRIPHERHGMFVAMPEAKTRIRISETEKAHRSSQSIRLEYGALNKAVDISCHKAEELAARQFLSPAVQEVLMEFSRDLPKLHMDFFPGHVLVASEHEYLGGPPKFRLNRDGAGFEQRIQPWIDSVETFRAMVEDGLRRISKYND